MELDRIVFVEGVALDPGVLQQAFDEVLRPAFVADELPGPATVIDERTGAPAQDLVVALLDDQPVGVGVHVEMAENLALLSYLAVREDVRSLGIGGRLLSRLRQVWIGSGVDLALAEIHDPRGHVESISERPAERLAFYQRHGATLLGPWIQPALSADGHRVADMLLIALHHGPGGDSAVIDASSLLAWTESYFAEEEGAVPGDAAYRALVARYGARPTIELLPLDHYTAVAPLVPLS